MCMRFRVSAPVLRSSRFCSCPCNCYNGQELDDADVSDSDAMSIDDSEPTVLACGDTEEGRREYRREISDNSSRRSSTSSAWSNFSERFAMDIEETYALHYPLSFWEIHDVQMASNLSEDRLRQQFPEIEDIHRIPRRKEEPALPPLPPCSHCKRPQLREICDALDCGMILCCPSCYHPQLGAPVDVVGEVLVRREIESCHCRCLCEEMEDKKDQARPPCWLSFLPEDSEPAEWVLQFLGQRGFCLQDRCQDGRFCFYRHDMARPTRHQIISGTWYADCRQHFEDLAVEIEQYGTRRTFPNGIQRDLSTYTTLPAALEAFFIRIDPTAFGDHYPHPQPPADATLNLYSSSDVDFFDTFGRAYHEPHLFTEEEHAALMTEFNARIHELAAEANNNGASDDEVDDDSSDPQAHGSTEFSSERIANLHSYILENEWRAHDNVVPGSELSLVIDPESFTADVELYRLFPDGLDVLRTRLSHHLYQRFLRISSESGMMPDSGELMEVVRIELEFRNYLTLLAAGTIIDIPARIAAIIAATPESRDQLVEELHHDASAAAQTEANQRAAALRQREANSTAMLSALQEISRRAASGEQPQPQAQAPAAQETHMSGAIQSPRSPELSPLSSPASDFMPSDLLASDTDSHRSSDEDSIDSEYDYFTDPATAEERTQAQVQARRDFDATRRMLLNHNQFLRDEAGVDVVDLELDLDGEGGGVEGGNGNGRGC